jgi:hypothetical protein
MGRHKIRHFEGKAYRLYPGETLEQAVEFCNLCAEDILFFGTETEAETLRVEWNADKPRVGKGSGRAGGARGATHAVDHRKHVHPGTPVEVCPICKYGMKLWRLWILTGRNAYRDNSLAFEPGSWGGYWEGNDEERRQCEEFIDR